MPHFNLCTDYVCHLNRKVNNSPIFLYRIQVFERNGDFCRQIGVRGDDPGQLMYPYGIAVDSLDNIYVCDLGTV